MLLFSFTFFSLFWPPIYLFFYLHQCYQCILFLWLLPDLGPFCNTSEVPISCILPCILQSFPATNWHVPSSVFLNVLKVPHYETFLQIPALSFYRKLYLLAGSHTKPHFLSFEDPLCASADVLQSCIKGNAKLNFSKS